VIQVEHISKKERGLSVKPMHGCLHCGQGILEYRGPHKTYEDVEEYTCQRCKRDHYLNKVTGQVSMRLETLMERYNPKEQDG
jgi:hypothetical protein